MPLDLFAEQPKKRPPLDLFADTPSVSVAKPPLDLFAETERQPLDLFAEPSPTPSQQPEEERFQKDYATLATTQGLHPDPDHPEHYYNYRAAWKAGKMAPGKTGHFPSEFKLPGHPDRYVEGIDTITGRKRPAGATGSFAPGWKDWATSYFSSFGTGLTQGFDSPEHQQELARFQEIDKEVAEPAFEKASKIAAWAALAVYGYQGIKAAPELWRMTRARLMKNPLTPQEQLETARFLQSEGFKEEAKTIGKLARKYPEIKAQLIREQQVASGFTSGKLLPAPPGYAPGAVPPYAQKFDITTPPPTVGALPPQVVPAVPPETLPGVAQAVVGAEAIPAALTPSPKAVPIDKPLLTAPTGKVREGKAVQLPRGKTFVPVGIGARPTSKAIAKKRLAKEQKLIQEQQLGFVLKGKPKTGKLFGGRRPTANQIKQSHVIAREKGWISTKGKVKPQYRRLAEAMTGKKTISKMTQEEATTFINALKKVPAPEFVAGKTKIASIPLTKKITPKGFFERNFKEPTLIKAITPSNRYAYTLGVSDFIEPSIRAKTAALNEIQDTSEWLDGMNKLTNKLAKTPLREITKSRIKNVPTEAEREIGRLIDRFETAGEAGLTGEKAQIFTELRKLTNVILDRTNEVREKVGLPPIKKLSGYLPHFADVLSKKRLAEKYPFPEEIKFWLDRVNPKHIFNPTAINRTVKDFEGRELNPFKLLKAMVSMDLKQVYLEQPNILFREQLNAFKGQMPAGTRRWLQAYMNEVIKGYPTKLDNLTNATLDKIGVTRAIDTILRPFGRGLGHNPSKEITGAISRLVHDAVIWGKIRLVIRNHTQKLLSLGLYDTKAFMKSLLPATDELKTILADSEFFKISGQQFMERLPEGVLGKLEKIGYKPYGHSHISNVKSTMKTAYYAAKELVDNPKFAHLGWTEADIKKEMEFGGNTAQYWYNLMGMPEIFRSGGGRFFATLQSWWMNYTTNYWREMLHRGFYGRTGWGKPIPVKWRLGALRHIVTSLLFVEGIRKAFGLDYKRIALLGVLPTYLSPPAQIVTGLYNYLVADSPWQKRQALNRIKRSWKAFVPGSGAWRDFSTVWKGEKPVKSLFFYSGKQPKKTTRKRRSGL